MATNSFKKIDIATYFENLTVELYVLYPYNTRQILCHSDVIYYMINKPIFYA